MKNNQISRRKFISTTAKGTAGVVGLSLLGSEIANAVPENKNRATSKVIIIDDAASGSGSPNWTIDQTTVQKMMDAGIRRLTGICDLGEAWKSLFTGITKTSVICIKVNCINSALSTHPGVTLSVVNGLKAMMFGTPAAAFPENNIIIWDRTNNELTSAGYTKNTGTTGVKCYGTDQSGVGYSTQSYTVNGSSQKISNILYTTTNYMINIAVLKNHSTTGTTLTMKNHYGTCNSPSNLHGSSGKVYLPALNSVDVIKNKTAICIIDAIYGIISGGPSGNPSVAPKKILISKDTVAIDRVGTELLKTSGMGTISYNTAISYINTAGASPYSLGNSDLANIEQITISSPSTNADPTVSITEPANNQIYGLGSNVTVKINPADSNGTISQVELYLDGTLNKTFTASPYQTTLSGLAAGTYILKANAIDNKGKLGCSTEVTFTIKDMTDIQDNNYAAFSNGEADIFANYPNPVKEFTTFSYHLHRPADVSIQLYNTQGSLIRTLVSERQDSGDYTFPWKVDESLSSGLYFVNFRINDILHSLKINVIK